MTISTVPLFKRAPWGLNRLGGHFENYYVGDYNTMCFMFNRNTSENLNITLSWSHDPLDYYFLVFSKFVTAQYFTIPVSQAWGWINVPILAPYVTVTLDGDTTSVGDRTDLSCYLSSASGLPVTPPYRIDPRILTFTGTNIAVGSSTVAPLKMHQGDVTVAYTCFPSGAGLIRLSLFPVNYNGVRLDKLWTIGNNATPGSIMEGSVVLPYIGLRTELDIIVGTAVASSVTVNIWPSADG